MKKIFVLALVLSSLSFGANICNEVMSDKDKAMMRPTVTILTPNDIEIDEERKTIVSPDMYFPAYEFLKKETYENMNLHPKIIKELENMGITKKQKIIISESKGRYLISRKERALLLITKNEEKNIFGRVDVIDDCN